MSFAPLLLRLPALPRTSAHAPRYQASLPDELSLTPGQQLRIVRLYDDAWGTAEIVSGGDPADVGRRGACPLVCLSTASSIGSGSGSGASVSRSGSGSIEGGSGENSL